MSVQPKSAPVPNCRTGGTAELAELAELIEPERRNSLFLAGQNAESRKPSESGKYGQYGQLFLLFYIYRVRSELPNWPSSPWKFDSRTIGGVSRSRREHG